MLRRVRQLSLCGPGGIGKTRLALRLAAALAPDYPDGAWVVDVADVAPGEADGADRLVPLLTATLGVLREPDRPLVETLLAALRGRTMLLVLDTCEHLVQSCADLVPRLLACPGLRLIATSREPLGVRGELVWRVPPLGVPPAEEAGQQVDDVAAYEAVRLFVARATAVRPGFSLDQANVTAVARACRTLDGVPLAIELAAAGIRAMSAEQICLRLADSLGLVAGDRAAPPRQQTLRAAVAWSYDQLSGPERVLLGRLSVFAGWSLEMAEQVCAGGDVGPADVLYLLTALIDKSLVSLDGQIGGAARYRLLGTVREFAAAQASAAGEAPGLRVAHRDCMLGLVEQIAGQAFVRGEPSWPARVTMYHRARADRANFHLALACCAERRDAAEGLRLCYSLAGSWLASGEVAEGAGWLDQMLALGQAVPPGLVARAHAVRAELAFEQQDYEGARAHARACVTLSPPPVDGDRGDGNPAAGLRLLALVALQADYLAEALRHADAAIESARQMGDDWEEGVALATRAAVIASQGKLADSQLAYEQALDVLKDNNGWGVANVLYGLGRLARSRHDPAAAIGYFGEALAIYRQIDARPEMARCLAGIGWVALSRLDLADARISLTESMRLSLATGQRLAIARGLSALAALALASGEIEAATKVAGAAQALLDAVGGRSSSAGLRLEEIFEVARGALGPAEVAALAEQGASMSPHEAAGIVATAAQEGGQAGPAGNDTLGRSGLPASRLTEREREVAVLVAAGLSNRAIGERLFISVATVARHVANIFAKLGLTSRAQVAAWVAADGARPPGSDRAM